MTQSQSSNIFEDDIYLQKQALQFWIDYLERGCRVGSALPKRLEQLGPSQIKLVERLKHIKGEVH